MKPASNMRIKALLTRMGQECTLERKTTTGTDRLNHSTGQYEMYSTVLAALYQPDADAGTTESGELDLANTRFAVPEGTDIRQDDHLIYDKVTYEVESVITRPEYLIVHAKATQS